MWQTSEGNRILTGAEAVLFRASLLDLVEQIKESGDNVCYGIPLFDELTWSQRLAVLEVLATCLLTAEAAMPKLTAVNEAAVAAVFQQVECRIDLEIRSDGDTSWRLLVWQALRESHGGPHAKTASDTTTKKDALFPTAITSRRRSSWHTAVQMLADRILWDRDYELTAEFMDEPPEKAAMLRQILGIDDDYFSAAASDLNSAAEIQQSLDRLQQLL